MKQKVFSIGSKVRALTAELLSKEGRRGGGCLVAAWVSQSLIYKKAFIYKPLFIRKQAAALGWGWRECSPNRGLTVSSHWTHLFSPFLSSPLNSKAFFLQKVPAEREDCVSIMSCGFKGSVLSQMHGEEPSACELTDAFPVGPEFIW